MQQRERTTFFELEQLEDETSTWWEPKTHDVWGWADEARQGSQGKPQLERLAEAVGYEVLAALKVRGADGKPADELVTWDGEWDDSEHGEGTEVVRKGDGRRGVSTRAADSDGDIKIRFDDDGSESGYIKPRDAWVLES